MKLIAERSGERRPYRWTIYRPMEGPYGGRVQLLTMIGTKKQALAHVRSGTRPEAMGISRMLTEGIRRHFTQEYDALRRKDR